MLETLSQGFRQARKALRGQTKLTESNVAAALQQVRLSLLEADVEYGVVKRFTQRVSDKAIGTTVAQNADRTKQLNPEQHFVGICHEELVTLLGDKAEPLALPQPLACIMMMGLQGAGKTTTTAKLALHLQRQGRRPLLVAADVSRPAAVQQLQILGKQANIPVYTQANLAPPQLCEQGMQHASSHGYDLVLLDTAGRLAMDDALMGQLQEIQERTNAHARLLVLDAMIGQAAVQTAQEFDKRLNLSGFILTKLDGDARGGAALSIRETTGKPIRFVGTGERLEALEAFRPEGLAGRILGMGDVVGLSQEFAQHVDEEKAQQDTKRLLQGRFTLQDFLSQLRLLKKMGPLRGIMERLPGMQDVLGANANLNEDSFKHIEAIILSMTPTERQQPTLCRHKSRLQRIARGCGRSVKDVRDLLKRFETMQNVVTKMGKQKGLWNRLTGMGQATGMPQMPGSLANPEAMLPSPDQSYQDGMGQGPAASMPRVCKQDKKRKRKLQAKARKHNRKKR